jgi:hypothetical protein
MLTFALILTAELILLFRLGLRDFMVWAEARHDEVCNPPYGDCPHLPTISAPTDFHARSISTEVQQHHGAR